MPFFANVQELNVSVSPHPLDGLKIKSSFPSKGNDLEPEFNEPLKSIEKSEKEA